MADFDRTNTFKRGMGVDGIANTIHFPPKISYCTILTTSVTDVQDILFYSISHQ